jgi:PII-like signaling protein
LGWKYRGEFASRLRGAWNERERQENAVLTTGPAKKVIIYVGEDHQYHGNSAYAAILDFLFYRGVAGANVMRGIAGFGADHHMHTTRILRLTENLPIKIEFIESAEKVEEILPKLYEMVGTGLIEVQDTNVLKPPQISAKTVAAPQGPASKREGKAKLMRIYIGENDKWRGKPLHTALVECMRANDIAGVTVYQGVLGYGANRRIHGKASISVSHDRPIMLAVVENEEKLRAFVPLLDEMVQQGLVVLSDVDIVKYTYDFRLAERRKESRA